MKKLILMFVVLISLTELVFAAVTDDDVWYLTQKIREVEKELGYRLEITSTYRSWDEQISLMRKFDEATLIKWYEIDTASAFIKYKNGELEKEQLVEVMKKNPLIKHPNGLAVDIGINSSGLTDDQVDDVIKALKGKGLYVLDERRYKQSCLHVSRKMR